MSKDGLVEISSDESKNSSESSSGILELKDLQPTVQKAPANSTTNQKVPVLNLANIAQLKIDNTSSRKS